MMPDASADAVQTDPAACYAALLLADVHPCYDSEGARQAAARVIAADWARSGLMALCGTATGPALRATHAIPTCARGALDALRQLTGVNVLPGTDGSRLLSERAAYHGWPRRGQTSVNGHCHLLPTADGWFALNLARNEDLELLPALFASGDDAAQSASQRAPHSPQVVEQLRAGHVPSIRACAARADTHSLLARGRLLGLAVAAPNDAAQGQLAAWYWVLASGDHVFRPANKKPKVLDLSALWAGPLCTHLLAAAGADVCKVESAARPDASRTGLPEFFDLLNTGKTHRLLDLAKATGIAELRQLIAGADIVVESARPRALQAFGIDAATCVLEQPGLVWLRITGHGSSAEQADWIAFGDDAAVAGGAAISTQQGPLFCGDALADPLTGLHAALAAWRHWLSGRAALLDVSLAATTAWCVRFARGLPCLPVDPAAVLRPARR